MSLNGLDDKAIQDAHQQASHEVGGWFLLQYISRDSVGLLGHGKGGVHEARATVANYTETSPLYGVIFYRRRKFLIKYIPEGTSRLLQARTTVHFQDIHERFSPYETLLEISTSDALNDTSLAASFALHTAASPSISSSRLDEITEDAEDNPIPRRPSDANSTSGNTIASHRSKRSKREMRSESSMSMGTAPRQPPLSQANIDRIARFSMSGARASVVTPPKSSSSTPFAQDRSLQHSSSASSPSTLQEQMRVSSRSTEPHFTSTDVSTAATSRNVEEPASQRGESPLATVLNSEKSKIDGGSIPPKSSELDVPRASASTERTSVETATTDGRNYLDEAYLGKLDFTPKVKLGPRPVTSEERTKRPMTASISSLPATYRASGKKPDVLRPKSQMPPSLITTNLTPTDHGRVPIPPVPSPREYSPRPVSRSSIKSLQTQKSTMTAERLRLMKAVELRQRQLKKSTPRLAPITPPDDAETPPASAIERSPAIGDAISVDNNTEPVSLPLRVHGQAGPQKADSGIELTSSHSVDPRSSQSDADDGRENRPPQIRAVEAGPAPSANEDQPQNLERNAPTRTTTDVTSRGGSEEQAKTPSEDAKPNTMTVTSRSDSRTASQSRADTGTTPTLPPTIAKSRQTADEATLKVLTGDAQSGLGIQDLESEGNAVPVIVMADGTRPVSAATQKGFRDDEPIANEDSPLGSPASPTTPKRQAGDLARRRRGIIEPLHVDEDEHTSDDEIFEEVQSATIAKARPVNVVKSPQAQEIIRRPSASSLHSSSSIRSIRVSPKAAQALSNRSIEASPFLSSSLDSSPVVASAFDSTESIPGKRNVSAGISKRIQALTEGSGRESTVVTSSPSTNAPRPLTPDAYPDDFLSKDRLRPVRGTSNRSQVNTYQRQVGRVNTALPIQGKSQASPLTASSLRINSRPSGMPESVTVTARIVRTNNDGQSSSNQNGKLQQPEIHMNLKRRSSQQEVNVGSETSSINNADPTHMSIPQSGTSSRSSNRRSWARRNQQQLSPSVEDFPSPPTHGVSNVAGSRTSFMMWDDEPSNAPKEGSRTSRFFKRMSTLGSSTKRKSAVHSPSSLDSGQQGTSPTTPIQEMPPAVVVGDLNIQFPDTLLWKRRIMEVDSKGFITFAIPLAMDIQKSSTKKYHLTDFGIPYSPDVDRQELPNSIMLDSLDGNITLQAACEDSLSHRQVLNTLRGHWKAWNAVGRL